MSTDRENLKNPQSKLPDVSLPVAGRDVSRRARGSRRRAAVLILFDHAECEACWDHVSRLAGLKEEIADWAGEVLVVVPEPLTSERLAAHELPDSFSVLEDPGRRLASGLRLEPPAVVIADQWAVVRHAEAVGPDHRFPEGREVVDWLRYMAIECPECEGEAL